MEYKPLVYKDEIMANFICLWLHAGRTKGYSETRVLMIITFLQRTIGHADLNAIDSFTLSKTTSPTSLAIRKLIAQGFIKRIAYGRYLPTVKGLKVVGEVIKDFKRTSNIMKEIINKINKSNDL